MIKNKHNLSYGRTPTETFLFIPFSNQFIIKLVQKRNYRFTNYYLLDTIYNYNWVFWKKHSKINPTVHLDIITYSNNNNLHVITKPLYMEKYVILYKFFSLVSNRYLFFISALEQRSGGLGRLWPSAGFYEREVVELFGIQISNLVDKRRLLLDYSDFSTPMSAEFDVNGIGELRYSIFTGTPVYTNNSFITL